VSNKRSDWSAEAGPEEVRRRAIGRRAYNGQRREEREWRRMKVCRLLFHYGILARGVLARIARELGLSRSTICRDRRALLARLNFRPCPHCGWPVRRWRLAVEMPDWASLPIPPAGDQEPAASGPAEHQPAMPTAPDDQQPSAQEVTAEELDAVIGRARRNLIPKREER
jgi:hypothetical protein